jgi:hypothetical protein
MYLKNLVLCSDVALREYVQSATRYTLVLSQDGPADEGI